MRVLGIDATAHLVDRLLAREVAYRVGITCRRLVGELTHLEDTFRGAPLGSTISRFSENPAESFESVVSGHAVRLPDGSDPGLVELAAGSACIPEQRNANSHCLSPFRRDRS